MKLHVGCGKKYLPGWTHLDLYTAPHIDIISDVEDMNMVDNGSVDVLYTCHMLEHIRRTSQSLKTDRYQHLSPVMKEFHRVIKPGGQVYIAVPDFAAISRIYQKEQVPLSDLLGLLYGGARDVVDHHETIFDFNTLKQILVQHGFSAVERYKTADFLPKDYDDYSRCMLPHLDFDNGTSMSLNVTATRM